MLWILILCSRSFCDFNMFLDTDVDDIMMTLTTLLGGNINIPTVFVPSSFSNHQFSVKLIDLFIFLIL